MQREKNVLPGINRKANWRSYCPGNAFLPMAIGMAICWNKIYIHCAMTYWFSSTMFDFWPVFLPPSFGSVYEIAIKNTCKRIMWKTHRLDWSTLMKPFNLWSKLVLRYDYMVAGHKWLKSNKRLLYEVAFSGSVP